MAYEIDFLAVGTASVVVMPSRFDSAISVAPAMNSSLALWMLGSPRPARRW